MKLTKEQIIEISIKSGKLIDAKQWFMNGFKGYHEYLKQFNKRHPNHKLCQENMKDEVLKILL